MGKSVTRLAEQFRPEHYELSLDINKTAMTFSGSVIITGKKIGRPTRRITFHQKELVITKAAIVSHDKKGNETTHEIDRIVHQHARDEVRIHTKHDIYPGLYKVELEFNGRITKPMNGMYPCYDIADGDNVILATQFESHHAREVFPSIDEPEAKAIFDLSLTVDNTTDTLLSNMPIKKHDIGTHAQTAVFESTPIMSSYLLAFTIGKLAYKESTTKHGITVRTYATPANVNHTDFALDTAVKCLDFYNDYFDIPYPLTKCDMIALPDFASGAMENWGLITYREQCMLYEEGVTSLPTKQYVALVVAHELAHQWFGNLVTMSWWTDLWLNEGFASWIEYLASNLLFPEWELWTQFAVDEQQPALKLDALEHTHPIEVPVRHPDEIRTIFDVISYNKGASVIHMLHDYIGPETFRDGLRLYLKRHAYKNTTTADLWQAFEEVSGKPIVRFMKEWTSEPGYPLVSVDTGPDFLSITQQRFVLNPQSQSRNSKQTWPIPLLTSATDVQLVTKTVTNVPIKKDHTDSSIRLNEGQKGFYRTIYSPDLIKSLTESIHKGSLPAIDRMSILADAFESAKAGYSSTVHALDLLTVYEHETSAVVWDIIAASLGSLRAVMDTDALRDAMKPYIIRLTKPEFSRLGWIRQEKEKHLDSLLRPTIIGLLCSADEPSVIEKVNTLYAGNKDAIDPDLRPIVYSTVARHGSQRIFDELVERYRITTSADEKLALSVGITSFKQPELIDQSLAFILSGDVKLQDISYFIAYNFGNRFAKRATWFWLKDNWHWLREHLGSDLSFFRMPLYVARSMHTTEQLTDFRAFFEKNNEPMLDRTTKQAIESIETSIAWYNRDADATLDWFTHHQS